MELATALFGRRWVGRDGGDNQRVRRDGGIAIAHGNRKAAFVSFYNIICAEAGGRDFGGINNDLARSGGNSVSSLQNHATGDANY